jgi:carbamoyl-phosphate synthase small subunit
MSLSSLLLLKNGHLFVGQGVGKIGTRYGECVFTTGYTGYTESLSDPSYAGQILCFAYPLVGNYGVAKDWQESARMYSEGVIFSSLPEESFHRQKDQDLTSFLSGNHRSGMVGIDTRKLVKILRNEGNQPCVLVVDEEAVILELQIKIQNGLGFEDICDMAENKTDIGLLDWAKRVNNLKELDKLKNKTYKLDSKILSNPTTKLAKTVVVLDCGAKQNIITELSQRVQNLIIVPANTPASEILRLNPDGVLLSNGPGDPRDYSYIIQTIKKILDSSSVSIMGICLGHQLLSLAIGCRVHKMKFGNRGANQPVKDLLDQKAYLTSQNHGYAVEQDTLPEDYNIYFKNLNDDSVEGVIHKSKPIFSVQFHPEACGGPQDTNWLFDKFVQSL